MRFANVLYIFVYGESPQAKIFLDQTVLNIMRCLLIATDIYKPVFLSLAAFTDSNQIDFFSC